jgi:hypothetical protein
METCLSLLMLIFTLEFDENGKTITTRTLLDEKIFRALSLSLKRFPEQYISLAFETPPVDDEYHVYLCPICLRNCFSIDRTGYYCSCEFTEDHFPPASVGGTLTLLVCKSCNNTAGSQFESSLAQKIEMVSFEKKVPNSVLKAKPFLII